MCTPPADNFFMKTRTVGWSRLTADVEEYGADGVLDAFCGRIAMGESPLDICKSKAIPWFVMRKWLEDDPHRISMWALAKRCFADGLQYEALYDVRNADIESVGLAKLQSEAKVKLSGKMNREEWGDRQTVEVKQTTVNIRMLLDKREAALRTITQDAIPDGGITDALQHIPSQADSEEMVI